MCDVRVYEINSTGANVLGIIKTHGDVLDLTGCFGEDRLRVRALFTVINEQTKLNAKENNVIEGVFGEARYALAA